eukprot:scaffold21839_cov86-Cyclotella_meneghiniana.AAC.1
MRVHAALIILIGGGRRISKRIMRNANALSVTSLFGGEGRGGSVDCCRAVICYASCDAAAGERVGCVEGGAGALGRRGSTCWKQ